jgi:hypothetical protein
MIPPNALPSVAFFYFSLKQKKIGRRKSKDCGGGNREQYK